MRFLFVLLLFHLSLAAAEDETFRVYSEHPRLFLNAHRLRLLRKERERQSMRWEQFDKLMRGNAQPPEPGFAWSFYYEITGDSAAAKRALAWAENAHDLREMAIVYDWCQQAMTPQQNAALAARIHGLLAVRPPESDLPSHRDRILAAIAIADTDQDFAERILREAVTVWWRRVYAPTLGTSRNLMVGGELFPLIEILHAVRDNLNIDLRDARPEWFEKLAEFHIASHYPAPYPSAENEYRIPAFSGDGEPDLKLAALSRAAGLALVAYDSNALPNQYLQGWLIQDRFLLRGSFGAPYEFLWANPYQPGLSYMHLPLVFHDPSSGTLLVRSSWEEDASWFGLLNGHMQRFENGTITAIEVGRKPQAAATLDLGPAAIVRGKLPLRFAIERQDVFIVGLGPNACYEVEVDDEEMREMNSDAAGTLEIRFLHERKTHALVHEEMSYESK